MIHLSTQHKLGVLQGLVVEQPVQFCPLCRGVTVLFLNGDTVDGEDGAIHESGFYSIGVHIEAAGKQFVHGEPHFSIKWWQRFLGAQPYGRYGDPCRGRANRHETH